MGQQDGGRLRPLRRPGRGDRCAARVGAGRRTQQRVQLAAHQVGKVVVTFSVTASFSVAGWRSLRTVVAAVLGVAASYAETQLPAAHGRRSHFRRLRNDLERGRDRRQVGLTRLGQDKAARQAPNSATPSARSSDFTCWLTAPGVTPSSSAARVELVARGRLERAQAVEGWQSMAHGACLCLIQAMFMHQIFWVNGALYFACIRRRAGKSQGRSNVRFLEEP